MRFLMLVCVDEAYELTPEEAAEVGPATERWVSEMDGKGIRVGGNRIEPVSKAVTVRVRNGETIVDKSPFAQTVPQIAGFDILECADLDEAIEVASKHSVAPFGVIEVRPFWQP